MYPHGVEQMTDALLHRWIQLLMLVRQNGQCGNRAISRPQTGVIILVLSSSNKTIGFGTAFQDTPCFSHEGRGAI